MAIFRTAAVTVQFSSMSCADSAGGNITMSQTDVSAGIHDSRDFATLPQELRRLRLQQQPCLVKA